MGVSGVVGLEVGEVCKTLEDHRVCTPPRNPLFSVLLIKNGSKILRVLVLVSWDLARAPRMLQDKLTRDSHMGTFKTEGEVFLDSQQLHGELFQITQPWASQFFVFYAQNPHPA